MNQPEDQRLKSNHSPDNPAWSVPERDTWQARLQASLAQRLDELRAAIRQLPAAELAARCGAEATPAGILLSYWGSPALITLPELEARDLRRAAPYSLFDAALLLYYLHCADGAPLSDRWVSFRELPGGAFYHAAFQGYSGNPLAKCFDPAPAAFHQAARRLGGVPLSGLTEYAYAFAPLPRLRLAALYWAGDEEFAGRAMILFDAASPHYMVLDGLAILGARLAGKLQKARLESGQL